MHQSSLLSNSSLQIKYLHSTFTNTVTSRAQNSFHMLTSPFLLNLHFEFKIHLNLRFEISLTGWRRQNYRLFLLFILNLLLSSPNLLLFSPSLFCSLRIFNQPLINFIAFSSTFIHLQSIIFND
jgi:hypothetical protein